MECQTSKFRTELYTVNDALTALLIAGSIDASESTIADSILKVVLGADIALLGLDQPPPLH